MWCELTSSWREHSPGVGSCSAMQQVGEVRKHRQRAQIKMIDHNETARCDATMIVASHLAVSLLIYRHFKRLLHQRCFICVQT